jgi:acyl dehydratase
MLPGVVLLAEVLEAVCSDGVLARAVGATPRIASAKFLAPVGPGSDLVVELRQSAARLRFEVKQQDRLIACGEFDADPS